MIDFDSLLKSTKRFVFSGCDKPVASSTKCWIGLSKPSKALALCFLIGRARFFIDNREWPNRELPLPRSILFHDFRGSWAGSDIIGQMLSRRGYDLETFCVSSVSQFFCIRGWKIQIYGCFFTAWNFRKYLNKIERTLSGCRFTPKSRNSFEESVFFSG